MVNQVETWQVKKVIVQMAVVKDRTAAQLKLELKRETKVNRELLNRTAAQLRFKLKRKNRERLHGSLEKSINLEDH